MKLLSKASNGKRGRAQKVVVYGPEGIGKSLLASKFPNPLFLDVEGSSDQLDVRRLGREELPDLITFESALNEVIAERPCATLVIDTADWLETLAEAATVAEKNDPQIKCIEDWGYGKGWIALKDRFTVTLSKLDRVIASGINVVLLAHSWVKKFEPPDGAGPYDRYELKLSKHVAPLVKEWADMLLFANWRVAVRERGRNEAGQKFKAAGGRERILFCNRTAAWDAKNRHGLKDEEKWGDNAEEAIKVIERAFRDVHAPWGSGVPSRIPGPVNIEDATTAAVVSAVAEPVPSPAPVITPVNGVDPELARICEPCGPAVTDYLIAQKRITPGQTWRDIPPAYAARICRNPAGFLKIIQNGGNCK